jgi:hypothetical protein
MNRGTGGHAVWERLFMSGETDDPDPGCHRPNAIVGWRHELPEDVGCRRWSLMPPVP